MEEYRKDHDDWNEFKKLLNLLRITLPIQEMEIWWVALGVNIGIEIDGKGKDYARPAVVVKKFNENSFFIIPLSKVKNPQLNIHIPISNFNLDVSSCAVVTQTRTIGNERFLQKIGIVNETEFEVIVKMIVQSIITRNNKT